MQLQHDAVPHDGNDDRDDWCLRGYRHAMNKPLTTSQAAARLGLSTSHTSRLASQGRIPRASKHGRDWFFEPPIEVLPPARPPGFPWLRKGQP